MDKLKGADLEVILAFGRAVWEESQKEPNFKHPRIQQVISKSARLEIWKQIVTDIIIDPEYVPSPVDMEYWDSTHDELYNLTKRNN